MEKSRFGDSLITQSDKITIDTVQDIGTHYLKGENKYTLHGDWISGFFIFLKLIDFIFAIEVWSDIATLQ